MAVLHQRTIIRQGIRQLLLNATAATDRVFPTRVLSLRRLELPAIAVYTLEEAVDADSQQAAPRELTRGMPVLIEGWVSGVDSSNVDDDMDALALEIETAMHADPYLGGAAGDSILDDTVLEVVEEGDRLLGLVALTYQVTYRTLAPEAPILDDAFSIAATHNLGGDVHQDEVAVDQFNLREVV